MRPLMGIVPGPVMTRVLLLDGPHTLLQARLPHGPRHPRTVRTLAEALALWAGRQLRVVLAAAGPGAFCATTPWFDTFDALSRSLLSKYRRDPIVELPGRHRLGVGVARRPERRRKWPSPGPSTVKALAREGVLPAVRATRASCSSSRPPAPLAKAHPGKRFRDRRRYPQLAVARATRGAVPSLSLLVAAVGRARLGGKVVVPRELEEAGVEADVVALALEDDAFQIVVVRCPPRLCGRAPLEGHALEHESGSPGT